MEGPRVVLEEGSEVTLSVESGGEGHVVKGAGYGVRASVGGHARNAVFRLVRRQLPTQLIRQDVVLGKEKREREKGREKRESKCKLKNSWTDASKNYKRCKSMMYK